MKYIAVTGGIGSGKSTVSQLFHSLGITVISADTIAKDLLAFDESVQKKIVAHFSKKILDETHTTIDRKKLRQSIFNSPKDRHWLEALMHPLIREKIREQAHSLTESPYCIIEIPLLQSRADFPYLDKVILVQADLESRLARVQQRDNTSKKEVEKIIENQAKEPDLLLLSDYQINNNSNIHSLKEQVGKLHELFLSL